MINLISNGGGTFGESGNEGVTWVRDSYTEPRESLFECDECGEEIEEWNLFTCLDGGEAAHIGCVEIAEGAGL